MIPVSTHERKRIIDHLEGEAYKTFLHKPTGHHFYDFKILVHFAHEDMVFLRYVDVDLRDDDRRYRYLCFDRVSLAATECPLLLESEEGHAQFVLSLQSVHSITWINGGVR
ncbi:hypothetical protein SAMN05421823_11933 [Catalinimonas alkaloidigena]|uniref:Uncharacterized protein n=1 Tax=Catalinimonas alkaloidigena TaxID=1075417 RepID=A0A1G9V6V0_9BACT|nr:hypothetical protein [Catalinimonas alkaloidigena]SDM67820.1 hypothetical protein SAMN05421823_11933 [Catalinimonas alkaloidigena]